MASDLAMGLTDGDILDAIAGGETAEVLANRLEVPLRDLLPRLNRLRHLGSVRRTIENDGAPLARWEHPSTDDGAE